MKIFNLIARVTISIQTKVIADTLKEAIQIAEERCIEQAGWDRGNESYVWIVDEFNGEVQDIRED